MTVLGILTKFPKTKLNQTTETKAFNNFFFKKKICLLSPGAKSVTSSSLEEYVCSIDI